MFWRTLTYAPLVAPFAIKEVQRSARDLALGPTSGGLKLTVGSDLSRGGGNNCNAGEELHDSDGLRRKLSNIVDAYCSFIATT